MLIAIEDARRVDAPVLLDLQRQAFHSEAAFYDDFRIPPLTQTLGELEAEFDDHVILKAVAAGTIVGSVRARRLGGTGHIERLIVLPGYQGHGIGTRLMQAIEARLCDVDAYELFTGQRSERNLRLYRRLGYREVGAAQTPSGVPLAHLRKPRPPALPPDEAGPHPAG